MRHYGITGNIGSGKTTVCRQFERLGVPVYYTDVAAKRLMTEDSQLVEAIRNTFGAAAYRPDGSLDRGYLAERVFGDDDQLRQLNALVHPAVHRDATDWRSRQSAPYTLYESALIFEIDAADRFDGVIVVAAPEAVRRQRVMVRDGVTAEAFAARAAKQLPDETKERRADHVILNDGRRLLLPQVLRLHRTLRG